MSDIGPGDVVVCVDAGTCEHCFHMDGYELVRGRYYTVFRVLPPRYDGDTSSVKVMEAPLPPGFSWCSHQFAAIDRADETFCQQVKKCRPLRTKEPA